MSFICTELPEIDSLADLLPAFEFDRLLDQDVTGALYKACHRSLDRDVAIKILPYGSGSDPRFRNSFQAKARAMARLTHPSLIRVYDSGDLDGQLYTVMEYVHGTSLQHCAHGKAVDPVQAVEIVTSACLGLAHAHENGVIHGDIRPANIFLTPKCETKIGNFGLPGHGRDDAGACVSEAPEYLAPEVIHQPESSGPQADVFALGVILRELLTGIPASLGDATKAVVSDPGLDAICRKASDPDPALRYPDARSLAEQLNLWMTERKSAISIRKPQPTFHPSAPANRRPAPACPSPSYHGPRPRLASSDKRHSAGNRTFVKYSVIILLLLCAGFLTNRILATKNQTDNLQQADQGGSSSVQSPNAKSIAVDRSSLSRELAVALTERTR